MRTALLLREDFALGELGRERGAGSGARSTEWAQPSSKIADIVTGRLELLRAIEESPDVQEAQRRIGELGRRFEWLKAVFVEDPEGEAPR